MADDILSIRRNKLKDLEKAGINPFGGKFEKTANLADIKKDFTEGKPVKVAGRIVGIREHVRAFFVISKIIQISSKFISKRIRLEKKFLS